MPLLVDTSLNTVNSQLSNVVICGNLTVWTRGYVYAGSQLLAVQQAGVFWMHEDPVTKSKRVTNSAGTVVSTIELDPWGADTNRSNNAAFQPRKFTSYTRDGNGSDEAMFRRHNRWHSRFDQPDPYDGSYSLANPQSFNRYAYVQNDPVNFVDPSGLLLEDPAGRSRPEPLSGLGFMGPGVHSFETTGYIQIGYFAETLLPAYLPVLVTAYYGVGGPSGGGGGGGDGQQNPVPLTQDQLDAIRNQIAAFLNDECANFINQIVGGRTGNPYDSKKQLLTDFNSVAGGNGGVFFGGNIEGGDARGTIPAGNAQIRIDTMRHFTDPNRAFGAAFVALHELIHIIAGNDIQLSEQVNKLGITVTAYPGKTVAYPTDKDNKNLQYSGYWGQALKNACDPKGY